MSQVAIIGGGIAGCTTAISLAKEGYEVHIFEKADDILLGTSARTPGRMGLGYHYFHFETAKMYMQHTVEFMKSYPDCFLGDKEEDAYLQNGRYFIVNDSLVTCQDLMATFDSISHEFETMVNNDHKNNIFGTAHLHRTMRKEEYQNDVDLKKVAFAIETKEHLLNWDKFSKKLKEEIREFENIQVHTKYEVDAPKITPEAKFQFPIKPDLEESSDLKFDYVVNCSWQNIEFINEKLGLGDSLFRKNKTKEATTYRLKLLAEVKLPESLKEKHSMFFCVGPHAMFSNLGNGIGRITFAPITNFGTTTESKIPSDFQKWLDEGLSEEETTKYGQKIIDGVATYIPKMAEAKILKVIPGIVKSKGEVDLQDKNSSFHQRDYSGVEEQQIGWVDNSVNILTYCLGNAKEVAEIIRGQLILRDDITRLATDLAGNISKRIFPNSESEQRIPNSILQSFFINHLTKNNKIRDFKQTRTDSPEISSDKGESSDETKSPQKKPVLAINKRIFNKIREAAYKKNEVNRKFKEWVAEIGGTEKWEEKSAKETMEEINNFNNQKEKGAKRFSSDNQAEFTAKRLKPSDQRDMKRT